MATAPVREASPKALSTIEAPTRNKREWLVEDWHLGILELTANIATRIPEAKITNPDLVAVFLEQLGEVDASDGVAPGTSQAAYAASLRQAQKDAQLAKPLTTHLFLYPGDIEGVDLPKLHYDLNSLLPDGAPRTQDWPQDARNMDYRLSMIQAGLSIQGVLVMFRHSKDGGPVLVTVSAQSQ